MNRPLERNVGGTQAASPDTSEKIPSYPWIEPLLPCHPTRSLNTKKLNILPYGFRWGYECFFFLTIVHTTVD